MEFKENQLLNLASFRHDNGLPFGLLSLYVTFVYVLVSSLIKQDEVTEYAQIDTQNMHLGMHVL